MRELLLVWLLILPACVGGPAWDSPPAGVPTRWRDQQLYVGREAWFLAPDPEAAASLLALATELGDGITRHSGGTPRAGLWLVLDRDEPLPIADATTYMALVPQWFERAAGVPAPPSARSDYRRRDRERSVEPDAELLARMTTVPVPKDAPELELPTALTSAVAFVVIVPTDACLAAAARRLTEAALAAAEIPAWKIAAVSLVAGHPATRLQGELASARRQVIGETWLRTLGAQPEQVAALRRDLGLLALADPARSEPMTPEQEAEIEAVVHGLTITGPDGRITVGGHPKRTLAEHYARQPWSVIVDLGPRPDDSFAGLVRAQGGVHIALPCTTLPPDRELCRRLDAVLHRYPEATVFVCAADAELAGTAVALHAYHCRGLDAEATLALARLYGVDSYLSLVRDVVEPPP